jgi:NTP pyrophosphatase (non-canonical NTP hydrolase)
MDANEYQHQALRTCPVTENGSQIDNGVLGLCGEAGELADLWKKHKHQSHPYERSKMIDELGDVLWYAAVLAEGLDVSLGYVMQENVRKLRTRYPLGFEAERSLNRET